MNKALRADAEAIVRAAVDAVRPEPAVRRALPLARLDGRICLVAAGKAAWRMADAAVRELPRGAEGVVITKYGHVMGDIPGVACFEAGHPLPDENGCRATRAALELTRGLSAEDTVLFLLSGGASALFEQPAVALDELRRVTEQLLARGADITEINTIRKRLSTVKGGRFARWCAPARIEALVLSDVLGDALDAIASGPAAADPTTCAAARAVAEKYDLTLSDASRACLGVETPKRVDNVHTQVIGSVRELCRAAAEEARSRGYEPRVLTDRLAGEARDAGVTLAETLKKAAGEGKKLALIAGGETVVHVTGTGLGGRNQELALAAAEPLAGMQNAALISVGSDGTDGPTDAAGGYADGDTHAALAEKGVSAARALRENDAYHALEAVDCLIKTGPTGTNVNDVCVALLDGPNG